MSELMVIDNLKPCPFEDEFHFFTDESTQDEYPNAIYSGLTYEYFVECGICSARGPSSTSFEEAAKAWNRREKENRSGK